MSSPFYYTVPEPEEFPLTPDGQPASAHVRCIIRHLFTHRDCSFSTEELASILLLAPEYIERTCRRLVALTLVTECAPSVYEYNLGSINTSLQARVEACLLD
jgi:hypothetical protein